MIITAILGCVSMILSYIRTTCLRMLSERQSRKIRQKLFRSILVKDLIFLDQHKTGEFGLHLSETIEKIINGFGEKFGIVVESIATMVVGFIIGKKRKVCLKSLIWIVSLFFKQKGLIKGWKLSLILITLLPMIILTISLLFKVNT